MANNRDHTVASTADVEKIARDAVSEWCLESRNWTGYDMPVHQQLRLLELFNNVFAQARAPLVEALETMPDPYTENQAFLDWYEDVRSAALTGTGEKFQG